MISRDVFYEERDGDAAALQAAMDRAAKLNRRVSFVVDCDEGFVEGQYGRNVRISLFQEDPR